MKTFGNQVNGQADNEFARGAGTRVWDDCNVSRVWNMYIYILLSI